MTQATQAVALPKNISHHVNTIAHERFMTKYPDERYYWSPNHKLNTEWLQTLVDVLGEFGNGPHDIRGMVIEPGNTVVVSVNRGEMAIVKVLEVDVENQTVTGRRTKRRYYYYSSNQGKEPRKQKYSSPSSMVVIS